MSQTKRRFRGTLKSDFAVEGTFVTIGCVTRVGGVGIEWEREDPIRCIDDSGSPGTDLGDQVADEIPFTMVLDAATTDSGGANKENYYMEVQAAAATARTWQLHYIAEGRYVQFEAKLTRYKPVEVGYREAVLVEGVLVREGDYTWNDIPA